MPTPLDDFFSQYPILRYDKEQTLILADDIPSGIFYVKSGFVKMSAILEDGREITLNIFKPGAFFPMIWAITDFPNNYYFRTITPTELHRAPKDALLEFLKKNPDVLFELTKRILTGIKGLLINIEHQLSGDSYHRVIAALVLAARRFGVKRKADLIIELPLTHQEIANTAGLTRETVSLAIEQLKKKKIISYEKRTIIIKDTAKLERESYVYEEEKPNPNTI